MHICFRSTAWRSALHALVVVAAEHGLSDVAPLGGHGEKTYLPSLTTY